MTPAARSRALEERTEELLRRQEHRVFVRADRLFGWLLLFQWALAMGTAAWVSPRAWAGEQSSPHLHLLGSVLLGSLIVLPTLLLTRLRPGRTSTRHAVACAEACLCALLIHLSGGRIETHFQIFGVLAFLAFYRDWRVLVTASAIVTADHLLRGVLWPRSVFGTELASSWRWVEHAAWVLFEDAVLIYSSLHARHEMRKMSAQRARLEATQESIEHEVAERTAELVTTNRELERTIDERVRAVEERDSLETQLHQAQRLEAVGQLAAGVAHEINTPIQYLGDNTRFLLESFADYERVLVAQRRLLEEPADLASERERLRELMEEVEPDYLAEEIPRALTQSLEGIERVSTIVKAMKAFSHPGVEEKTLVDLNEAIRSTATVSRNEYKYVAELELDLDPELPLLTAFAGELNQVLLNLIVNAAHAIGSAQPEGSESMGWIRVSTRSEDGQAVVRVEDSGPGVPEEIRQRVFDPFFTTKAVGKGTGQGLPIAHNVVSTHEGTLELEQAAEGGALFVVRLPYETADGAERAA